MGVRVLCQTDAYHTAKDGIALNIAIFGKKGS
jgi:hypothetical protein